MVNHACEEYGAGRLPFGIPRGHFQTHFFAGSERSARFGPAAIGAFQPQVNFQIVDHRSPNEPFCNRNKFALVGVSVGGDIARFHTENGQATNTTQFGGRRKFHLAFLT